MREDSAFAINHALRSMGLASLSEAGALIPQLAMFVRDDRHFRRLLLACEPEDRQHMYDALAPNLRFKPRTLAAYIIEEALDAEARQLPIIGPDGQLQPFKVPALQSPAPATVEDAIATAAVAEAMAKERLWVVCVVCTREDVFRGVTKEDAVADARKAGWRMGLKRSSPGAEPVQVEVCPKCVRERAPRVIAA